MPCNSEYLNATDLEVEISRVQCLLKEIRTGRPVDPTSSEWDGYHPDVYNRIDRAKADDVVGRLCTLLSKVPDITKYSLEMQIWWRDHQAADRKRRERERKAAQKQALQDRALEKLTEEERTALGLERRVDQERRVSYNHKVQPKKVRLVINRRKSKSK